jgi:ubiquinone/menaquinone biosynthesis C-methylase UbiE
VPPSHHLLLLALDDKLFMSPLKKDVEKCLDVGKGTGMWAIDFADSYPNCEVIGTDISPIQPAWTPPNLKFEIEDCTQPWTFDANTFDFIHMRYPFGSIPDWDALFEQAFRACKPGGRIESLEASPHMESDDGSIGPMSAMSQWGTFFVEGGKMLGRTFEVLKHDVQRQGMLKAGFVDVDIRDYKVPLASWPKDPKFRDIGQFARAAHEADYEGYVSYMAKLVQGWERDEVLVYCAHLRNEMANDKHHTWFRMRSVWGRKPAI